MTNNKTIEKIAALEAELKKHQEHGEELLAQIAELKSSEKEEYEWPKYGDTYFTVSSSGRTIHCDWDDDSFDYGAKFVGNVFRTLKEAEFAIERLKVLAEMRRFAFEPDWNGDNQGKWYVYLSGSSIEIAYTYNDCFGVPVFESKEAAKKCIAAIGESRLLKYWFGVTTKEVAHD